MMTLVKNEKGFTLIEIMISSAIMLTVILVTMTLIQNQFNSQLEFRKVNARDTLKNLADNFSQNSLILNISANSAFNAGSQFQQCVLGGAGLCTSTSPQSLTDPKQGLIDSTKPATALNLKTPPVPFILTDSSGTQQFSGPWDVTNNQLNSVPVFYDISASPCSQYQKQNYALGTLPNNTTTDECPLAVMTSFVADCGIGAASCTQALDVTVYYQVATGWPPSVNQNQGSMFYHKTFLLNPREVVKNQRFSNDLFAQIELFR